MKYIILAIAILALLLGVANRVSITGMWEIGRVQTNTLEIITDTNITQNKTLDTLIEINNSQNETAITQNKINEVILETLGLKLKAFKGKQEGK